MAAMAGLLQRIPPPPPRSCHHPQPPIISARHSPRSPRQPIITRSSSSPPPSSTTATTSSSSGSESVMKLTYLEINSWLWELAGGFRILVDPILVGNLDFGAPWLFDAAKKRLKDDLPPPAADLLLITQSLDDHCHMRTLTRLSAVAPDLPVVTTPNAGRLIAALPFRDVTYLEPGQSATIAQRVTVLATAGPVLGPPWQLPENGYIVAAAGGGRDGGRDGAPSLYYEPHCVYDASFLRDRGLRADVVITPVVKQLLPANFTLVSGQEDAVELARLLGARYVVPMSNGDVDAKGLLTAVLSTQGTTQAFKAMLSEALPQAQVLDPTPGVPLHLYFP